MSDPRDGTAPDDGTAPEDEEAFHWAGDEVGGRDGDHLPVRRAREAVTEFSPSDPDSAPAPRPSALTALLTGVFGVGYLALTVGWILGTQYTSAGTAQLLPQVLWQFGEFTAIIAAPLWFGAVSRLTRGGRLAHRVGWLALGLGVLLPWPVLPLLVVS